MMAGLVPAMPVASALSLRWGVNLIETPSAPFGSAQCGTVLDEVSDAGLADIAPVVFFWQATPAAEVPLRGSFRPERLAAVLRQARDAGLGAWPKVHLWIPGHWAGAARPARAEHWLSAWGGLLREVAEVASSEGAAGLVIGTELVGVESADGWGGVSSDLRRRFSGRLAYAAHNQAGVARFRAWDQLDDVTVSLWPPLGEDPSPRAMRARIARALDEAVAAAPTDRALWLSEIGIRSKHGAQAEPWRSPEETAGFPDEALQARTIALWDMMARSRGLRRVWWWCCYTDPDAGGVRDTDFTPQGKLGWRVLSQVARGLTPDLGGR